VGYDFKKIKSNALARAVRSGDTALEELILDKARILGLAIANVVNLLNPDLIVLGGGLIEALGRVILPVARQTMRQYAMPALAQAVKIKSAELKDDAIVRGAAKLAADRLKEA
jgi:glucokinase